MTADDQPIISVEAALRRLEPGLPGSVRYRFRNALDHFERSARIFDTDREMASFRAITGEEEAATALIKAIQLRRYQHANEFNPYSHIHKAAVMVCVDAVTKVLQPLLGEFKLIFNFEKARIDVKVPLSTFGVQGDDAFALQPVEPLGLAHTVEGVGERNLYDDTLRGLAEEASFTDIKRMVSAIANGRNSLLYASDAAVPCSRATEEMIRHRARRAHTLLVLSIMVLQTPNHQPMVRQTILAVLGVIYKLPANEAT